MQYWCRPSWNPSLPLVCEKHSWPFRVYSQWASVLAFAMALTNGYNWLQWSYSHSMTLNIKGKKPQTLTLNVNRPYAGEKYIHLSSQSDLSFTTVRPLSSSHRDTSIWLQLSNRIRYCWLSLCVDTDIIVSTDGVGLDPALAVDLNPEGRHQCTSVIQVENHLVTYSLFVMPRFYWANTKAIAIIRSVSTER